MSRKEFAHPRCKFIRRALARPGRPLPATRPFLPDGSARCAVCRHSLSTWHAAPVMATVVNSWIANGTASRLLDAARREIHARQAVVRDVLGDLPEFRGSQGLHFWLQAPANCTAERFVSATRSAGVLVRPSDLYAVGERPVMPGVRPAIGDPPAEELLRGLRLLRSVFNDLQTSTDPELSHVGN
jgi:DNA-binding transcriptional MocR family regulator